MNRRYDYVPVLRWRSAEREALGLLTPDIKSALMPLVEVPPDLFLPRRGKGGVVRKPRDPAVVCQELVNGLEQWWGKPRLLLDMSLVYRHPLLSNLSPWHLVQPLLNEERLTIVPVITMRQSYPKDWHPSPTIMIESSPASSNGVCLRIKEICLYASNLRRRLDNILDQVHLSPESVDLILDSECVNDASLAYDVVCSRIPYLQEWRSFTITSGSFPEDLSQERGFSPGSISYRKRLEWINWKSAVSAEDLKRNPLFGDYTAQFARYVPPKGNPRPSASVRYTSGDQWIILRGEMIEGHPIGRGQWTGWAQLLCDMPEYMGPTYSKGDSYIFTRSQDVSDPGTSTDWLFASINHHLTLTVRQLANPFAA